MTSGDRLILRIEKPVAGGRMLARHEGAVALVADAIPGETVEAEVERIQRQTIWATTRRVIEASADRIEPPCHWSCGGSLYAHIRYERQLDLKRDVVRDAFERLAHLPIEQEIPVMPSQLDGYRMRARLHIRNGRLGFFREGTHELCDAASTRQLLPATIDALSRLMKALNGMPSGAVTEIEMSENRPASERACHLVLRPETDPSRLGSVTAVEGLTGISCGQINHSRTLTVWGSPIVADDVEIGGGARPGSTPSTGPTTSVRLTRHAHAFFQSNRYLLSNLATAVADAVRGGPVIDLYAGAGLFAIAVASRGSLEVTAIEGDRITAEDLKRNAAPLNGAVRPGHESVEAFLARRQPTARVGTVIVDPPRTGMTRAALRGAVSLGADRLVYVSCDVATLARDARLLADAGYRLMTLRAFDLFPNTGHVEGLAVFDRDH